MATASLTMERDCATEEREMRRRKEGWRERYIGRGEIWSNRREEKEKRKRREREEKEKKKRRKTEGMEKKRRSGGERREGTFILSHQCVEVRSR